ncbi:Hint domain-containing protein [Palleronia sediminis]|uniref:Hint domain-containing protein n=1 Tax=Palleronia sediminis TaxID=2547833 RepID=A0A4R6A6V8_9RHOB|nr:Hint domain-containing protein [Palleronia sediminis]TDL76573.1 Hint domain-containing protein [Palleronia sediminis]
MAQYTVVGKGELDPDDIVVDGPGLFRVEADKLQAVDLSDGDSVVIAPTADQEIQLGTSAGAPISVSVEFDGANPHVFGMVIGPNIAADVAIENNVTLATIQAGKAHSLTVNGAAGSVVAGEIRGSENDDALTFGHQSELDGITLGRGDDVLTVGKNADFWGDLNAGDGRDTIVIGDGYDFHARKLMTGEGADTIWLGDAANGARAFELDAGRGDDTVRLGGIDPSMANRIMAGSGSDYDELTIATSSPAERADLIAALQAQGYTQNGAGWDEASKSTVTWQNTKIENFDRINIVCFASGTRITTAEGAVAIEDLRTGDRVLTRDAGFQSIRWIGRTRVPADGHLAPIRFAQGAIGNTRALRVSPQHRILLAHRQLGLYFDEAEVLVPARMLVNGRTITVDPGGEVEYHHMLFDDHQIVFAEGAPSESFHPGRIGMGSLAREARAEIHALFPELAEDPRAYGASARITLRHHEARLASELMGLSPPQQERPTA